MGGEKENFEGFPKKMTIEASTLYNRVGSDNPNGLSYESSIGKREFVSWPEIFGAIAGGSHMGEQLLAQHREQVIKAAGEMKNIADEVIKICKEK